jgi:hypothetical protein
MQQNIPMIRRRQAFLFGFPLALLELSLFVVSIAYSSRLLPLQAILLGLPLYLVIPAIAGYWFCRQRPAHNSASGSTGFHVGLVGFAIFMLATALIFAIMFMRYINTPHIFSPRAPHEWGLYDPKGELRTLATTLGILAVVNGIGILLSVMGGLIGGALAQWTMTAHTQPGQPQA